MYMDYSTKIKTLLSKNASKISITADLWTFDDRQPYFGITAHMVNDNWERM